MVQWQNTDAYMNAKQFYNQTGVAIGNAMNPNGCHTVFGSLLMSAATTIIGTFLSGNGEYITQTVSSVVGNIDDNISNIKEFKDLLKQYNEIGEDGESKDNLYNKLRNLAENSNNRTINRLFNKIENPT